MKPRILLVCVLLAAPAFAPAASKEIQELQRDIALLQQQIKDLQRSQDEKFASVTELARQSIEAANRASTGAAVIQSNLDKSLRATETAVGAPLAGVNSRVKEISDNITTLTQAVSDLTATLNRMQTQMTDISQQIKTMQTPIQAPAQSQPGPGGPGGSPAAASNAPCPTSASGLYDNALRDYRSGKMDIAIPEFNDYTRCFGDTPLAANAQFYIASYHYGQHDFENAVKEFDLVVERYGDSANKAPEALLYKGRALVQMPGHKTEGANEFREVIKRWPRTEAAKSACEDLKAVGYNCPVPPAAPAKKGGGARKK